MVTSHVAFYLGIPEIAVALYPLSLLLPVAPMPKLAINKHRHLAALETDVRTARHCAHILAIAITSTPQLPCQHPLGLGAVAAITLHAASPLLGSEVVDHGKLKIES